MLATLVGILAGLAAIALQSVGLAVARFSLGEFAGFTPSQASGEHAIAPPPGTVLSPWSIVLVMVLGGLASGLLVFWLSPESAGAGTDAAIDAFHNKRGEMRSRVLFVKTVASSITIGTGGSGGREGPIAQIGAAIGSWIGTRLNLSHRDRRILLAAGMGAGVGAIFRAPLAGAIFAAEILYSDADLEADAIVPTTTSSIVAYSVFTQSLPAETRFTPLFGGNLQHLFASPIELVPYTILAIALILVGMFYVNLFRGVQGFFDRLPILAHFRPAIGAGCAGLIGIALFNLFREDPRVLAVFGTGYGLLQSALMQSATIGVPLLLTIAFAKMMTTALSIGSGGAGGVFGPSMVIGGCVGAAIGLTLQGIWPAVVRYPEAFAIVGMAGFFAGVARAPISTVIMVRALTGDFGLLVPTMLVCTLTFITCKRWKLYQSQVSTRMDSKAHRGDFIVDVLEGLYVRNVYQKERDFVRIPEGMTLNEIVHRLAQNHQHYFPVVDAQGKMVGIFTDDDVRSYLYDDVLWDLVVAEDLMSEQVVTVTPKDDLNTAMKRFTSLNLEELPVVDADDPGRLLGMLRRKETIAAYNQRLMEHKKAAEE